MEQLRATLKSDLQEKNDILDKLTHERGELYIAQDSETRDKNIYQNAGFGIAGFKCNSALCTGYFFVSCSFFGCGSVSFHVPNLIMPIPFERFSTRFLVDKSTVFMIQL